MKRSNGNKMKKNLKRTLILAAGGVLAACSQQGSETFDLEVAKQKWNSSGVKWTEVELQLLDAGEILYRRNCSVCHRPDGEGDIQMGSPALHGSPIATGPKSDFNQRILQGKKGTAMPAFATALSDEQIAAIATYVRNAWGNLSADIVSAEDVKRLR